MSRARGAGLVPAKRGRSFVIFFGPWSVTVAVVILVGAAFLPANGFSFEICLWKILSGHPCPGCGLSRSVCNLARGNPALALGYHPFGFLVLPYAVLAASRLLWPRALKTWVREGMARNEPWIMRSAAVLLGLFLLFGLTRLTLSWLSIWSPF